MYTNEMSEMLNDLGILLNVDLNFQLANSTDWKTRIMFPSDFKEKELYHIENIDPKTFWDRIKKRIGLQDSVRVLSADVKRAKLKHNT